MVFLKNVARGIYPTVFALTFALGCTQGFSLNLGSLYENVSEEVFSNMSVQEATFVKYVLMSGDPNTKGSVSWLEESFVRDLKTNGCVTVSSNAVLVAFLYPLHYLPPDYENGLLFANADIAGSPNSTTDFVEWISIARLLSDDAESLRVLCRLMFWFSAESDGVESETLLEVCEVFEMKDKGWELVKISRKTLE